MTESLTERIVEANEVLLVRGDLDAVERYFAPDYVVHLTELGRAGGHDFIRRAVSGWRRAFADLSVRVEPLVESIDRLSWHRTLEGRHVGDYRGFPATDRPIRWRDLVVSRFEGDLIVEDWLVSDLAERLLADRRR